MRPAGDLKGSFDWMALASAMPYKPEPLPTALGGGLVMSGRLIFGGGLVVNTATSAGFVDFHDGADATGLAFLRVQVPASSSAPVTVPGAGLLCEIGLFITTSSALVNGAAWVKPLWRYAGTPPGE